MFEAAHILGTPSSSIPLGTARGSEICNEQAAEPSTARVALFRHMVDERRGYWEVRKAACGMYNCFGLVWGSRRTGIYDEPEIEKILREDDYRRLGEREQPKPGDVALYRQVGGATQILHAGVVQHLEFVGDPAATTEPIVYVLSKLADWGGEVLHHVHRFALSTIVEDDDGASATVEYWTDRSTGDQ